MSKTNREEYESEETEVKSKKELIEKWELAIESAEFYGKGKEEELIGYMKDFVSDLNQIDEPEITLNEAFNKLEETHILSKEEIVKHFEQLEIHNGKVTYGDYETLSQEWIEQKSIDTHVDALSGEVQLTFRLDDLQNLLVPKLEEMKVPKMWHDAIVQNKEDGHSLRWTLNYIDDLNVNDVDSFARAWIAYPNIEVKEEQKYIVRFNRGAYKPVFIALDKISNHIHYVESHDYNKEDLRVHLNEWEIRALDDGDVLFEHFAVKAEELGE